MWLEETPVEQYKIGSETVYVKREDMYGQYPAPPLAKLRGARLRIKELVEEYHYKLIGVFDTRISKAGQGVAVICQEIGVECWTGFPQLKDTPISERHKIAESLGAKLYPMKAGRTAVVYSQFKHIVENALGYMLPLGLVCIQSSDAVASLVKKYNVYFNSIVVSTGTGTIASGLARGFTGKVYGISCGMNTGLQMKRIQTLCPNELFFNLQLIQSEHDYYDALDTSSCPFPTSPYYDMKAWEWLLKHIDELEKPILFWNIGA